MNPISDKRVFGFHSKKSDVFEIEFNSEGFNEIGIDTGYVINSVADLKIKLAELNSNNPFLKLLFRGQKSDYRLQITKSTQTSFLYPTIFRELCNTVSKENQIISETREYKNLDSLKGPIHAINSFYQTKLDEFRPSNVDKRTTSGIEIVSIVQHYELFNTPIFDLTGEWQVACTFAKKDNSSSFLYVFGIPYFNHPVNIFPELELAIVDLSKLCPPSALRPHFQSGYGATNSKYFSQNIEDMIQNPESTTPPKEWDFTKLLIAKFILTEDFWKSEAAPKTKPNFYFPDQRDKFFELSNNLLNSLGNKSREPKILD